MKTPEDPSPETADIDSVVADLAPGTARHRARRDAEITLAAAQGTKHREIAEAHSVCTRTVERVLKRNRAPLEKLQEMFRRTVLELGAERQEEMVEALLDSASDSANRNQASCARVYGELAGIIGKQHPMVFGDVNISNQTVELSPTISLEYDPELAAKLRAKILGTSG